MFSMTLHHCITCIKLTHRIRPELVPETSSVSWSLDRLLVWNSHLLRSRWEDQQLRSWKNSVHQFPTNPNRQQRISHVLTYFESKASWTQNDWNDRCKSMATIALHVEWMWRHEEQSYRLASKFKTWRNLNNRGSLQSVVWDEYHNFGLAGTKTCEILLISMSFSTVRLGTLAASHANG